MWRTGKQQYGKPDQDPKAVSRLGDRDPGPVRGVCLEAEASEESKQTPTPQAGLDIGFTYGHWYLPFLSSGIVRLIARAKRRSCLWATAPSDLPTSTGMRGTATRADRIRPEGDDRKMTPPLFCGATMGGD